MSFGRASCSRSAPRAARRRRWPGRKTPLPGTGTRSLRLLVPVELAGDLVQADAEADGAAVWAGGGEAACEPILYEGLHLGLGEPIAHLDGRVTGYGGEDAIFPIVAGVRAGYGRAGVLEGSGDVTACQSRDHG